MDSPPTQTLEQLLDEIINWIQESIVNVKSCLWILCSSVPCLSMLYSSVPCLSMPIVLEENVKTFSKRFAILLFLRRDAVPRFGGVHAHLISVMCRRFCENHVSIGRLRCNSQIFKQFTEMLDPLVKQLFQLPKLQDADVDDTLIRYHLPQDFLRFLGEFLTYELSDFSSSGLDGILKELKYLIPIFRDRPFQAVEYKQVQCLWDHFEWLINRAGRFVHTFLLYPDLLDRQFCETLSASIELLKSNIIEFLTTLPNLSTSSVVVYHDVDSFFIIHSLVNDLEDLLSQTDGPVVDIKDQIGGLHIGLKLSWSLLKEHVEMKQFKEIAVQVRDMAYGAEYMINSCLARESHVWYVKLSLTSVIRDINRDIKLIEHRLLEMKERSDDCALRSVSNTFANKLSMHDRRSDTEVNEIIVGFQDEEQSILEQLLEGTGNLQKVGIVGTPGLGKTTLAKKLHKHHAVCDRFDRRSWCVVSQRYERKNLLVDILKGLGEEVKPDMDEENLELKIYQTLKGRRYLITLDDIWKLDVWGDLCSCFPDEENGSRILFTSRNEDAAPSESIINSLPFLSNDQCWELIRKLVFRGETCPPMLKGIGQEISAKCKGLPLVVTVIAGILSTVDKELVAWRNVMQDLKLREFLDQNEQVLQTLELSYKHLLQHLKPCFLYFALFREDEEISVKKLKQLWVAEGFIEEDEEKKSVESIAEEYLMELINKSLVMAVKGGLDGKVKTCVMHDLMHSMCTRIAEEEKFVKWVDSCSSPEYLKFNRLRFPSRFGETIQLCGSRCRSIFLDLDCMPSYSQSRVSFVGNTSLRVLDDKDHCVDWDSIRHVVSLRYLAVSGEFPNSNRSFLKLEYLILPSTVVSIPSGILKLSKLRYLKAKTVKVEDDYEISQSPNNLEYLSVLWISNHKCIQLLRSMPHLCRLKCVIFPEDCPRVNLSFLTQLEALSISWPSKDETGKKKFGFKFPRSIRKLSISTNSYSWRSMSKIGAELPNLEVFKLAGDGLGDTWNTSDSKFRKLRFLQLRHGKLRQWSISSSACECFPCLQLIALFDLPCLEKIPREIGEIETLKSIILLNCLMSAEESAKEIEQEHRDFGNEDFRVVIGKHPW